MGTLFDNRSAAGQRADFARATPKLLVSVRDFDEIADALGGGADIVDLKEPRRGPLAPASVELWRQAASLWDASNSGPPRPPLSAALGEQEEAARLAERLPPAFAFAKAGPSRCETLSKVGDLWAETRQSLDDRIELVAVAYADWKNAQCADPELIVRAAVDAGFKRCLIDTYEKDGRSTLDHLGISGLIRLAETARQGGLWWALAGSIRADHVRLLWQHDLLPDCFGVRGDVCEHGRTGRLCPERVKRWKSSLSVHSDH